MPIVDAHLDLAYNVLRGRDVTRPAADQPIAESEIATVGFPDLRCGGVTRVFATVFCQPQTTRHAGYTTPQQAHDQAMTQLDQYLAWHNAGELRVDGLPLKDERSDAIRATILLEGAEAIRSPDDVSSFYSLGVRIVGLSWQRTRYAGGTATPGPLTDAGRQIVRAFDTMGIVHDASHLAEQSFWDLTHATDRLIIASHSNCRSIVRHDPNERHLTDAMIRAIVARRGVIGVNFFDRFLLPADQYGKRRATLDDVVAHVRHICDLAGNANHVGLGTDMDGGLGREQIPSEISSSADLPKLADKLSSSGFDATAIGKIMHGNWGRVLP
jgi:membrane dipeptidase